MSDLVDIVIDSASLSMADVGKAAEEAGQLLLADFEAIVRDVALFATDLSIQTKVFIKGLRFNCRGQNYREALLPDSAKWDGTMVYRETNSRVNNMAWAREEKYIRLSPNDQVPHAMYFLELHPHRVSYLYRSVEDDLDGTRHWDIV
eukprot:gene22320-28438_t